MCLAKTRPNSPPIQLMISLGQPSFFFFGIHMMLYQAQKPLVYCAWGVPGQREKERERERERERLRLRERERERERETKVDVTTVALKWLMSLHFPKQKNCTFRSASLKCTPYCGPCPKFAPFVSSPLKWSRMWRLNWQHVHSFRCQKVHPSLFHLSNGVTTSQSDRLLGIKDKN